MTLLTVIRDVCAVVGVTAPASVFGSIATNRTMQEMVALANEMAQRIGYDTREWSLMMVEANISGASLIGSSYYNLPSNFKRMGINSQVWRVSTPQTPMRFIPNNEEWLRRRLNNITDPRGEWMLGGTTSITVFPLLEPTDAIRFVYLDKNFVNVHGDNVSESDVFVNDDDTFWLDERLLKLGMIWQWKAQKGSPYAEDMGTYGDALTYAMGADSPAPIMIGGLPISATMNSTYPWATP